MTGQQYKLLEFIRARLMADGIAPSFDEMKDHLGLKSKSNVHRMVCCLVEQGHIVRLCNRARAIALPEMGGIGPGVDALAKSVFLEILDIVKSQSRFDISAAAAFRMIEIKCKKAVLA